MALVCFLGHLEMFTDIDVQRCVGEDVCFFFGVFSS